MSIPKKRLFILKASEDIDVAELNNIVSQISLYSIDSSIIEVESYSQLYKTLENEGTYDYIYLASHGCEDYWGSISGKLSVTWVEFAALICSCETSNQNTIFFHSCCRGGLSQVAWSMFECCPKIQYVCGPRQNITNLELITAFNLFLFYAEVKRIDPVIAAEKVLRAIDIRIVCFDRVEEIVSVGYQEHCKRIANPMIDAFQEIAKKHAELNTI